MRLAFSACKRLYAVSSAVPRTPFQTAPIFHRSNLTCSLGRLSPQPFSSRNAFTAPCSVPALVTNHTRLTQNSFQHAKGLSIGKLRNQTAAGRAFSSSITSSPLIASPESLPTTATRPVVGYWLLGNAALVFGIVILGGLTRLTESGLSIVEWKPVTGVLPPLNQREWEEEFEKYKQFPEYKMLNNNMTLFEFKRIFYMEWAHRIWGRVIGMAFLVPGIYYARKGYMTPATKKAVAIIGALIGFQGFLGWYMVKSGLDNAIVENNAVPRVSHYRLAAHLGTAFVLYCAMAITGLRVLRNARPIFGQAVKTLPSSVTVLDNLRKFRKMAHITAGLVFLTAISGAFVAGLDAGLLYNEFPLMGGRVVPDDIWSEQYGTARREDDQVVGLWRNIFENPTTVQFNHRVLAMTTVATVLALFAASRGLPLTRRSRMATNFLVAAAAGQATLGILTLLNGVPIPLAAAHQGGSLTLLSMAIWLMHELKYLPK